MTAPTTTRTYPHHRTVAEVMTRDVITVTPTTSFREIVRLLSEHHLGALPVIDADGRLVGVVSEDDLLAKERHLDPPLLGSLRRSWRAEHARAEATTAGEMMSAPAVTVEGSVSLRWAARLMHARGLRRLCVILGDDHLIGIVTRGDLLRAFARSDAEIEREISEGVVVATMWLDSGSVSVDVTDGVVRLAGELERSSEVEILAALVAGLDGVVAVENHLRCRWDDRVANEPAPLF